MNPVLARALRAHGGLVDPVALARGTFTGPGFDPRPALERLAQVGRAVLSDFELSESLVVGVFGHPGQVLVEDLDELGPSLGEHEVVAALAGDPRARSALAMPMPEPFVGDRDPGDERGVGDLDPAQQHALDVVATGAHLFLDAPPGADTTTTVAALVADAAATGRKVLYLPGHRRAAVALTERLEVLGLGDLVLDVAPTAGWRSAVCRRLLGAMTLEQRPLDVTSITRRREELVTRREELRGYVDALHAPREPWGCSAYDALQALARLTAPRPAPQTTVRLAPEVARALVGEERSHVAGRLVRAAELGAFEIQPGSSPWYGADLDSRSAADAAVERLERLLDDGLPRLELRAKQVAEQTGLTPPTTLAAWHEQLSMLAGVRASLDTFQPIVFERSAADLVAATATSQWRAERGIEMSGTHRRRLRKQAKDMVRPGRPVADLHAALVEIDRQREVWQAHCPAGGWPRLPEGLADIEAEHAAVRADLEALETVLATTPAGGDLASIRIDELTERLRRLRASTSALETLPERTRLVRSLLDVGIGELLTDLATRRVGSHLVAAELELAWWTGVFEQIMRAEPSLAGFDGARLGALAAAYRELDLEHVAHLPEPVHAAVVGRIRTVLRTHRDQAELLFAELVDEHMVSLRDTIERFGDVARELRPVVAAAPMLVPHLAPPTRSVDLLVVDAADHLDLEVVLPALARARQVVVVGDAKSASGSAVRSLAKVLPHVPLRVGDTRRDPYLTAFLAEHGYEGVLEPVPLPRSTPLVGFSLVDGKGMPDADSGAVVSTRAEVEHVVELVLTHAVTRTDESLAVVTVSPQHADRVREAVLAEVRDNPALAAFFDTARSEPFVVTDLAGVAGLRRDCVVLSVGYGRTPHGRVLHGLAPLTREGGDALLLSALAATRHRLEVVAAFRGEDLDPERLRAPGSRLLADLLTFAAERASGAGAQADPSFEVREDDATDRLVLDLAERLWREGFVVEVGHGLPGGLRIPLVVGHRELPDRFLVAVLTDDAAYTSEPSVRVRDRQVAARLERLGWVVTRVWSAAAFLDPQAEAQTIARLAHEAADAALAAEPSRRTAPPAQLVDDADDDADGAVSALNPSAASAASSPGLASGASAASPTVASPSAAGSSSAAPRGAPAGSSSAASRGATSFPSAASSGTAGSPSAASPTAAGATSPTPSAASAHSAGTPAAPSAASPATGAPRGANDAGPAAPRTGATATIPAVFAADGPEIPLAGGAFQPAFDDLVAGDASPTAPPSGVGRPAFSPVTPEASAPTGTAAEGSPTSVSPTSVSPTSASPASESPASASPSSRSAASSAESEGSSPASPSSVPSPSPASPAPSPASPGASPFASAGSAAAPRTTGGRAWPAVEVSGHVSPSPASGDLASPSSTGAGVGPREVPAAQASQHSAGTARSAESVGGSPSTARDARSAQSPAAELRARRGPRPPLARGLPIAAYGEDELEMLARWILADGVERDEQSLAEELRTELGLKKRGARVDAVLSAVARRTL